MQRQPRLGDILDDYCPRERRLTNHAVVAMIGDTVRLTRCTTCDAEHDYKEGKVPRPRKKATPPVPTAPPVAIAKRVTHEEPAATAQRIEVEASHILEAPHSVGTPQRVETPHSLTAPHNEDLEELAGFADASPADVQAPLDAAADGPGDDERVVPNADQGPVHRQLIRAQLPRHEGQPQVQRSAPDFTIRQPANRPNRFRPRASRQPAFQGPSFRNSSGNGSGYGHPRGNSQRPAGGHSSMPRHARHQSSNKRSK